MVSNRSNTLAKSSNDEPDAYTLIIRPEGTSAVPVPLRLRHVLKKLLRTYSFRCTSITAAGPQDDSAVCGSGVNDRAAGDAPEVF